MIVRPRENWFRVLFVWDGSVLQSILPQLVFVGLVSSLAVLTHGKIFGEKIPLNTAPFTLFGLALAIFLAFRNTASYERFTEGRRLWGELLISSRVLTSQILAYIPEDTAERTRVLDTLIASVYALKHQLRGTDPTPDLVRLIGQRATEDLRHRCYKPSALLDEMRRGLVTLQGGTSSPDITRWLFDAQISKLEHTVGGCERIASTPIPYSYRVLLHRTVYAYCILLPFGLVDSTVFFTPLICVLIAYTLIALEAIADEVAEPFGLAPNALALDSITRTIERSLLELRGREIPEATVPGPAYQLT